MKLFIAWYYQKDVNLVGSRDIAVQHFVDKTTNDSGLNTTRNKPDLLIYHL